MAPNTLAAFLLLGSALLLLSVRRPKYLRVQILSCSAFLIAFLGFIGYIYGKALFYKIDPHIGMALHTSVALMLLSLGILFANPERGLIAVIASDRTGGIMARRLLPQAIIIPPIAGYFIMSGERLQVYSPEVGISLLSVLNVIIFTVLIWQNAKTLCTADRRRYRAKMGLIKAKSDLETQVDQRTLQLQLVNEQLQQQILDSKVTEQALQKNYNLLLTVINSTPTALFVKDIQGCYMMLNAAGASIIGKSFDEIIGRDDSELFPPEIAANITKTDRQILTAGKTQVMEEELPVQGKLRTFLSTKNAYRDGQGNISGIVSIARDISDRKQAEVANRSLAAILEATPDFVGICDLDGHAVYMNKAGRTMVGIDENEDISHRQVGEFAAPSARSTLQQAIATAISEGVWSGETAFVSASGVEIPVSQVIISHQAPDGQLAYISTIARDISDRKRTEQALQLSQARFAGILEIADDAIISVDANQKIIMFNQGAESIFGWTAAEAIGQSLNLLLPEAFATSDSHLVTNFGGGVKQARKMGNRKEIFARRRDGTEFPAEASISQLEVAGEIIFTAILRDVTASRQAEASVRLSEERYRSLAIATAQMVWTTNASGVPDEPLPDWIAYTGMSFEETRDNWTEAVHPEDRDRTIQAWTRAVETKSLYEVEHRLRAADGSYRYFWVRGVPIVAADGSVREWVGAHTDISDRVQVLAALRESATQYRQQAAQLEKAFRDLHETQTQLIQTEKISSLGQLVAGVAHEINNPINFIYGNITHASQYAKELLELLHLYQEKYPNPVPEIALSAEDIEIDYLMEDFPKILESMKVGADRIRDLVVSLRNFSRLDESQMKRVDIHEGIESTLVILQHKLKANAVRPAIEIIKDYGSFGKVECYAGQLNQVFMNLLANAIDALEEYNTKRSPQEIYASPNTIKISTSATSDTVTIRIADNGMGINQEVIRKLFDPFFTTKPVGKGTGLGLSISYKIIVEKHRGKLHCVSAPWKGAEFVIEIPISQNLSAAATENVKEMVS
ncbi:PAS domain S-box protein [Microcoleus sp. bin38.metabat.b11b12b14.051]|uniref:PAS domain S-box protein n=1 Tax=Microcoleus sp. bin38.metabat.b11b12b14.051 TaxID=2742709 RepID=UPI0025F58C5F|nr:PAS domain S-box protein [Microcoleus sp. bin38.metabat.b11b12b14.051]